MNWIHLEHSMDFTVLYPYCSKQLRECLKHTSDVDEQIIQIIILIIYSKTTVIKIPNHQPMKGCI